MALVKYNNNSLSAITAASSLPTGAMTLIKEQTASSSSTVDFVDGTSDVVLDSTYPIYLFKFINIHPSADQVEFRFNGSDDDSSHSYDVSKTTTFHEAYQGEDDAAQNIQYKTGSDLANGTGFQTLSGDCGNDNDQGLSGELYLFSPFSTTYVKHFMSRFNFAHRADYTVDNYIAGYFNTTSAIDEIQFKPASGTIDAGTFKLYGIKDS